MLILHVLVVFGRVGSVLDFFRVLVHGLVLLLLAGRFVKEQYGLVVTLATDVTGRIEVFVRNQLLLLFVVYRVGRSLLNLAQMVNTRTLDFVL